jgi:low temperature requirement protein LtrA
VIVAAVSQVAHALSEDHSAPGMLVICGLFIPVFWIWAGHTAVIKKVPPLFRSLITNEREQKKDGV